MSRLCAICTHPELDAIRHDYATHIPNRRIATQYTLSESGIRRHFATHEAVPIRRESLPANIRATKRRTPDPRQQGAHIAVADLPATQAVFLEGFIEKANETEACTIAGISKPTVRYWEEHDPTFSLRYQQAKSEVDDRVRAEIWRRAVTGFKRIVVTPRGEKVEITEFSDRMLELLAKARMAEFRTQTKVDITAQTQTVYIYEQLLASIHNPVIGSAIHDALADPRTSLGQSSGTRVDSE